MKAARDTGQNSTKAGRGRQWSVVPRPFLKWAGGKGQLADLLIELAPKVFRAYHEPFLGGGAMFFSLFRAGLLAGTEVYLSDINSELVATWRAIRDDVEGVIRELQLHRYDRDHYYRVREQDPAMLSPAELAARMIYLNRTGFNGLYRVNSKGKFNVPFGRYKNPLICDRENLEAVAGALGGVEIRCEPFENVLERAKNGDFVYFDPPYVPLNATSNFVNYAQYGFTLEDQRRLAGVFDELARRGVFVMLSNSNTGFVRELYREHRQVPVLARRSINSKGNRRGPIGELVILSYS